MLLSGGEPLLRPDVLELAAHARGLGMRTVLSTNGTRIDAATARAIAVAGGNQSGVAIACVDPQGLVHPDQFSWHATAGDVRRQPFGEIWARGNPVLAPYRRRPRALTGRCAGCRFVDLCNGGLRVRAESASGDARASDPACYLADDEIGAGAR